MRNIIFRVIGVILILVSVGIVIDMEFGLFLRDRLSTFDIIPVVMMIGLPMLAGITFLVRSITNAKRKVQVVSFIEWVLLAAYVVALLSILFLGRGCMQTGTESISLKQYIKYTTNLIPFKTIGTYIHSFINHSINYDIIIENLFGNFILFMPMGLLLPCLIGKLRTWKWFLIVMIVMLCSVELVQMFTRTGSLDVDDVILNMSGACFVFAVMKIKKIIRFCKRIYLM